MTLKAKVLSAVDRCGSKLVICALIYVYLKGVCFLTDIPTYEGGEM